MGGRTRGTFCPENDVLPECDMGGRTRGTFCPENDVLPECDMGGRTRGTFCPENDVLPECDNWEGGHGELSALRTNVLPECDMGLLEHPSNPCHMLECAVSVKRYIRSYSYKQKVSFKLALN